MFVLTIVRIFTCLYLVSPSKPTPMLSKTDSNNPSLPVKVKTPVDQKSENLNHEAASVKHRHEAAHTVVPSTSYRPQYYARKHLQTVKKVVKRNTQDTLGSLTDTMNMQQKRLDNGSDMQLVRLKGSVLLKHKVLKQKVLTKIALVARGSNLSSVPEKKNSSAETVKVKRDTFSVQTRHRVKNKRKRHTMVSINIKIDKALHSF